MKKELLKYSVDELQEAIWEIKEREAEEEMTNLPKEGTFYPYKNVNEFLVTDDVIHNSKNGYYDYYIAHLDEGSEGMDYLIRVKRNAFQHTDEEIVWNSLKHNWIDGADENGWEPYFESIDVQKVGCYGVSLIDMDATKLDDEY